MPIYECIALSFNFNVVRVAGSHLWRGKRQWLKSKMLRLWRQSLKHMGLLWVIKSVQWGLESLDKKHRELGEEQLRRRRNLLDCQRVYEYRRFTNIKFLLLWRLLHRLSRLLVLPQKQRPFLPLIALWGKRVPLMKLFSLLLLILVKFLL